MSKTDLLVNALLVLAPAFLAVLTWAAAKLAAFVNAHVASKYVAGVLTRLDYAVANAVKTVEQTVASDLRAPDGSLAPNAALTAKATAIKVAKGYLGPEGLRQLLDVLGISPGEGETLLSDRVEAAVHDLKAGQGAAPVATATAAIAVPAKVTSDAGR